ncbi:hypothetical protein L2735_06490 [Shewanella olleyana]|uniref:hypothetical protein n=1 Tax=Shewanella olleyana TaxID=135626 RepID=UPI00200D159A|nr:hypothetical protein [Shewanella olleyana]MCL1066456.1 hypothetical protein [Shewanella olleyana]
MTTEKKVVDGVYETKKMYLTIGTNSVNKRFKPSRKYISRYNIEKESLIRLKGINGVPNLISFDDQQKILVMSKLPGQSPSHLNKQNLHDLTVIINKMLDSGVARHALPIRDLIVDSSNKLGVVDFERSTLKGSIFRFDWYVAKKVTHYHLYRLIAQFQPNLLTRKQALKLNFVTTLRQAFKR